jgi:hypothetical protein
MLTMPAPNLRCSLQFMTPGELKHMHGQLRYTPTHTRVPVPTITVHAGLQELRSSDLIDRTRGLGAVSYIDRDSMASHAWGDQGSSDNGQCSTDSD